MKLPIGSDHFGQVMEKKLTLVDKSLFMKELFEQQEIHVTLITRPRRFGKTLNLSMLHHFLASEVLGFSTKELFHSLKISNYPECMEHQGKYPVIFMSFKDIKQSTFKETYDKLYELMVEIYSQHTYLETSPVLHSHQKTFYHLLMSRQANPAQLENSLKMLTECLFQHHGIRPWLLIDEYDTPLHESYVQGYYPQIVNLMRGLLSAVLKSNPYLERAVITGILRVAKESLFSGLNNLEVYTLLRPEYGDCFGFTEVEVQELLSQSNVVGQEEAIQDWYNGV